MLEQALEFLVFIRFYDGSTGKSPDFRLFGVRLILLVVLQMRMCVWTDSDLTVLHLRRFKRCKYSSSRCVRLLRLKRVVLHKHGLIMNPFMVKLPIPV